jgi:hypothetical protein
MLTIPQTLHPRKCPGFIYHPLTMDTLLKSTCLKAVHVPCGGLKENEKKENSIK